MSNLELIQEVATAPLKQWENFYVIVGSSAAALTGLMFVVITLIPAMRSSAPGQSGIETFGTPTVVHFCVGLFVSAIVSAPWPELFPPGLLLAIGGFFGIAYVVIVALRAHRQTDYRPVFEDWLWHALLPFAAYVMIAGGGISLADRPVPSLSAIAIATLLLLFIGIHNAWDGVTYIAIERIKADRTAEIGERT